MFKGLMSRARSRRRILVAYRTGSEIGSVQRIAVSVETNASIADLAKEIGISLDLPPANLALEIGEGFRLRFQDGVDVILDGEVVTALAEVGASGVSLPPTVVLSSPKTSHASVVSQDDPGRLQIRLVTADLARKHARATPKDKSEPTTGVLAFEGEFVSGNTSLRNLQEEAVRVFGWEGANFEDERCHHEKEAVCSCAIAQEVEQHGLFSTLHCRFSIDGTECGNANCPYSHTKLFEIKSEHAPHCDVCAEALGFPCSKCMKKVEGQNVSPSSVIYCPLVQNAGCHHLHHAHCLGTRTSGAPIPCASGCRISKFPREAALLSDDAPYLIIVWNGDSIDKIPIVGRTFRKGNGFQLPTDSVISIVEDFLSGQSYKTSGLSLRIHSRDPLTEAVTFTQTTLVSVCSSSTHSNQNYRRFDLFSALHAPVPYTNPRANTFTVDFHTAESPIVSCGCTVLKDLFPRTLPTAAGGIILLYVVRRLNETAEENAESKRGKESIYLANSAWQPSIEQTRRGMAALLSSLYILAHIVGQKGVAAEKSVLSMMYNICRFPPAVRALGILLMNRTPQAEERTPLSEAIYYALLDFSSQGPIHISGNASRIFETARILLARILAVAEDVPPATAATRPIEEMSLMCASSQKRLKDPVHFASAIVERSICSLRSRGGELYRPTADGDIDMLEELQDGILLQILSQCRGLRGSSTVVLRKDNIDSVPPSASFSLESVGRDFNLAIQHANKTELVSRGPLELKAMDVVPPQVVVDEEGLLAVFTGRGCGSTRDVNFFRPTNGGDTEVDVNDVSHQLEKLVPFRKAEDTWQVDSFGGNLALSRPPDEAIVLCLDLSESMNARSGVSQSGKQSGPNKESDPETESLQFVRDQTEDLAMDVILQNAKLYLLDQHPSCHHAWKACIDEVSSHSRSTARRSAASRLLSELGIMARRDALRLSTPQTNPLVAKYVCFASASKDQADSLVDCLFQLIDGLGIVGSVGVHPYDVPANLLDPRTGDLLTDPVRPSNAPNKYSYVNRSSKDWFEEDPQWPSGPIAPSQASASSLTSQVAIKNAVKTWVSGASLIPQSAGFLLALSSSSAREDHKNAIIITLVHDGQQSVWHLRTDTPTRTLYALANRATKAIYSSFTIRLSRNRATISDSAQLTLGLTDLAHGGVVEISRANPHERRAYEVHVGYYGTVLKLLLPRNAPILSLLSHVRHATDDFKMSDELLWHGLRDAGDGVQSGTPARNEDLLHKYMEGRTTGPILFESCPWQWILSGSHEMRESSRHLTRLHLLKELFTVFVNRASSFDTKVSLVLGLVTFSDNASVKQELTPVFENFRQELEKVDAEGDTAVYDALDQARAWFAHGDDTSSDTTARDVCKALVKNSIVVDSVQVGKEHNTALHAISVATGGYRFFPRTSLGDALSIFDLETMLNSAERPPRRFMAAAALELYGSTNRYPIDDITLDRFPKRAEHSKLHKSVKPAASSVGMSSTNDERLKRIMREIKALVTDPHPQIDLYVNDTDISFLKVILEAPKDDADKCPYKGGCFLLTCDFPAGYPRDPPEIRFVTFILHPNVSKQGKVCVAELGRLWSSDITLKEILSLIYGLLLEPDLENPLEIQASLKYYDDDGTYALAVANAVEEHAAKSREKWRDELEDE